MPTSHYHQQQVTYLYNSTKGTKNFIQHFQAPHCNKRKLKQCACMHVHIYLYACIEASSEQRRDLFSFALNELGIGAMGQPVKPVKINAVESTAKYTFLICTHSIRQCCCIV